MCPVKPLRTTGKDVPRTPSPTPDNKDSVRTRDPQTANQPVTQDLRVEGSRGEEEGRTGKESPVTIPLLDLWVKRTGVPGEKRVGRDLQDEAIFKSKKGV